VLKFRRTLDQDLIKVRAAAASLRSSVRGEHSTSSKKSVTFEDENDTLAQSQTAERLQYSQLLREDRGRKVNIKRVLDSVGQELILTQDFEDGKRDDLQSCRGSSIDRSSQISSRQSSQRREASLELRSEELANIQ
jgi:hypothetical protein